MEDYESSVLLSDASIWDCILMLSSDSDMPTLPVCWVTGGWPGPVGGHSPAIDVSVARNVAHHGSDTWPQLSPGTHVSSVSPVGNQANVGAGVGSSDSRYLHTRPRNPGPLSGSDHQAIVTQIWVSITAINKHTFESRGAVHTREMWPMLASDLDCPELTGNCSVTGHSSHTYNQLQQQQQQWEPVSNCSGVIPSRE